MVIIFSQDIMSKNSIIKQDENCMKTLNIENGQDEEKHKDQDTVNQVRMPPDQPPTSLGVPVTGSIF